MGWGVGCVGDGFVFVVVLKVAGVRVGRGLCCVGGFEGCRREGGVWAVLCWWFWRLSDVRVGTWAMLDDEWIAAEESPNEPNEEWPSVFHRDAQEEDENGDKDKEIHNLSDCELENELRDFDDLPMDDLDGSNDMDENLVYSEGLPLEDNIHQINDDLGF
uniref:Uncharacterized protein n=1 Tax=Fagus sylvatica TaxID=28930 RepID=A0A2N9IKD3_FAGSY